MTEKNEHHRVDAVTDGACEMRRYHQRPSALPLSVDMQRGETATSLCSRQSAVNGHHRMRGLCRDFVISYVDLCNGEPQAVTRIAELTGADPEELQLHTPCLIEPGWFQLGLERIKFTALLRNGGQLCPLCIAEDECRDARFGPCQRDIWQVAAFRRCRSHGVAFERPQFFGRHREVHDFVQILKTWTPVGIMHVGADDAALEDYLVDRIKNGLGRDWIDRQAIHVVWLFAEALGTLLTRGSEGRRTKQSVQELIHAGAVGFDVISRGPQEIRNTLTDIRSQTGGSGNAYGKLYTPILSCLIERRMDPEFDEIRKLVREFILDNFPVSPGTSILGEPCTEARVFTVHTASKHFGVPISRLTRQLRSEGLLGTRPTNIKSDGSSPISKVQMAASVAEVRKLLSVKQAQSVIGADRYVMERLCAAGLLVPHFADDGGMPMFHHDEVMRFVKRLQDAATTIRKPSRYWRPITSAAARTHCSTAWIISQVFDGKLELAARLPEPFMLAEFLVPMNPLKALLLERPEDMVTAADAAKWLAADVRTIHAMAIDGHLPSQMVESRLANRPRRLIRTADLEAFAHRYVMLRALNGQRKAQYTATLAFIKAHGVRPLLMRAGMRPVFDRQAIERLSRLPGGEQLARLLAVEDTRLAQQAEPGSGADCTDHVEGRA